MPGPSALTAASDDGGSGQANDHHRHRPRVEWDRLLARAFQIEVTVCPAAVWRLPGEGGKGYPCALFVQISNCWTGAAASCCGKPGSCYQMPWYIRPGANGIDQTSLNEPCPSAPDAR